jgi:hypothetical protein
MCCQSIISMKPKGASEWKEGFFPRDGPCILAGKKEKAPKENKHNIC